MKSVYTYRHTESDGQLYNWSSAPWSGENEKMTNNGIKTATILRAVYRAKYTEWNSTGKDHGKLSFRDFQRILRKNDIAVDDRTILGKWNLLEDKEIIYTLPDKKTGIVDLGSITDTLPELTFDYQKSCTDTNHTYIHTKTEEASE